MAEIDKDQLKNIDISYILPDDLLYSGNPIDDLHLMERITEQVTIIGGIVPAQTSQFIEQLLQDADSLNTETSAPPPVTTTAPGSWCPYSTHDGCGCPPGKAWNYKGLFKIPYFQFFRNLSFFIEIFSSLLYIRTKFEQYQR